MKNIKNIIIVVALVATGFITDRVSAEQYRDAEELAQAFLMHDTDHYLGYVNAQGTLDYSQQLNIRFVMTKDLWITDMWVNETNIPLPKPLSGLPIPEHGYKGFNLNLSAVDKGGQLSSYGYFYTNALFQGDRIAVVMEPIMPSIFVPFPSDDPNSLYIQVTGADSWGWSYDSTRGGFLIQVGAGTIGAEYKIVNGDGDTLKRGLIDPFNGQEVANDTSVVNIHQAGGVKTFEIGTNGYEPFRYQRYACTVVRDGQATPAMVYGVSGIDRQRLFVQASGLNGGTIEIRRWNATGQMEEVPTVSYSYGEKDNTAIATTEYLDKAVVTVRPSPTEQKDVPSPFYISFQRWY